MGIDFVEFTNESLINYSGLKIAKNILDTSNLKERLDKLPRHGLASKYSEIIFNEIAFLCLGKTSFDTINEFRNDDSYKTIMDFDKISPEATFRQKLDKLGKNRELEKILLDENANMLKINKAKLSYCHEDYVPLDLDVTPMDNSNSKKEGVSWTYKKFMGYSPMMAYFGEEGYLLNTELRKGSQHSQSGTRNFLSKTIKLARKLTDGKILLRMDSGNDALENIVECLSSDIPVDYLIKRNLRKESKEEWLNTALLLKSDKVITEKKEEYFGIKSVKKMLNINGETKEIDLKIAFHVKKIKERNKQKLLICELEVDTYWISLDNICGKKVVKLYNNHGTSEQFHSEIKSDMGIERFPSGKFDTNYLILQLGMIAYNILKLIGQKSLDKADCPLKTKVKRRRVRTIIQNIMYFSSKIVSHARKSYMKISKNGAWSKTFKRLETAFGNSCA